MSVDDHVRTFMSTSVIHSFIHSMLNILCVFVHRHGEAVLILMYDRLDSMSLIGQQQHPTTHHIVLRICVNIGYVKATNIDMLTRYF